jgi:hypothetical protein
MEQKFLQYKSNWRKRITKKVKLGCVKMINFCIRFIGGVNIFCNLTKFFCNLIIFNVLTLIKLYNYVGNSNIRQTNDTRKTT